MKRRKVDVIYSIAIVVVSAILVWANQLWVYPPVGYLDPWFYAGYHMHITELLQSFPNAYYGTRVPWTVLGWLVHRVFSIEASLYVLALSLFYLSVFSLYYAVRRIYASPEAGFVAAVLLGTNAWFLWSIGWNYVDGPAIASLLLGLAAMAEGACGRHWRLATAAWGASAAVTLVLVLTLVVLLPVEVGMFLAFNRIGLRRPVRSLVAWSVLGFTTAFIVMGAANALVGGNFSFILTQFVAAFSLLPQVDRYYAPWRDWVWSAPWLLFPMMTALGSIAVVASRRAPQSLRIAAWGCIAALAVFTILQAKHISMLMYYYRINALWPFVFFFVGGCLAAGKKVGHPSTTFAITAAIVCVAPWILGHLGWQLPFSHTQTTSGPILFAGPGVELGWAICGGILLAASALYDRPIAALPPIVLIAILGIPTIAIFTPISLFDDPTFRDASLLTFRISAWIDAFHDRSAPAIWWSPHDDESRLLESLGSMYISPNPADVSAGERVILLSSIPDQLISEKTTLASKHIAVESAAEQTFSEGPITIYAIAGKAVAKSQGTP